MWDIWAKVVVTSNDSMQPACNTHFALIEREFLETGLHVDFS